MSEITSRDAQFMIGHCQSELVGIGGTEKSSIYPSSFKTCAIAALTLEEGITTDTLLTICALRTRVNISEIGSLILIDIFPCRLHYQLALITPGISPRNAISRILLRAKPNFRNVPRGRPVSAQRLRCRVGFALRGNCCNFRRA